MILTASYVIAYGGFYLAGDIKPISLLGYVVISG